MRRARIRWEGPVSIEDVLSLTDDEHDYGLYQVYGYHVVFGPGALLYIGMARDQTFAARVRQHHVEWLREENDVRMRIGRISPEDYEHDPQGWKDWEKLVTDTEALLIYWHSPPYNSRNISEYRGQALHVQNWGDRGSLLPECTSHWQPLRPRDNDETAA